MVTLTIELGQNEQRVLASDCGLAAMHARKMYANTM